MIDQIPNFSVPRYLSPELLKEADAIVSEDKAIREKIAYASGTADRLLARGDISGEVVQREAKAGKYAVIDCVKNRIGIAGRMVAWLTKVQNESLAYAEDRRKLAASTKQEAAEGIVKLGFEGEVAGRLSQQHPKAREYERQAEDAHSLHLAIINNHAGPADSLHKAMKKQLEEAVRRAVE